MMKKRTSLDSVFSTVEPALPTPITKPVSVEQGTTARTKRPGIKQQTVYLPEPVYEQLRRLGFEEHRKMHDYLMEGLDRVFADRGLKSIKELIS